MSEEQKAAQSLLNLGNALKRLKEALREPEANTLVIDGTIQRFEFVIKLYWKTLKRLLLLEGIETTTPREALRQAFKVGWIQDENVWLQMLKDRNETSHIYDETAAKRIYRNIQSNYGILDETYHFLLDKFSKEAQGTN
ncbi:nucleotidyltransferase [Heliobacterium undosum]|uniref:Nucleotidyltransferase n=1 Tax=Heliomicrobium undosum TaxID=121734 RepID=A0A845L016_9FIRM|nr:HI0074 family nucleotidyltransferase substrate-binding subunit [Heliomicrobium undosum]MZP28189.1 nucleotidyltransferase [Heliomicrobium undosum]